MLHTFPAALAATVVALLGAPSVLAQEELPTIIEGHVFSKWTGVPLAEARIQILSQNAAGPQHNFVVTTDESGFYTASVPAGFELFGLHATCGARFRDGTRNVVVQITLPDPIQALVRRDVYMEVPRRRSDTCLHLLFPTASR